MVKDIQTEVMMEAIRRLINETIDDIDDGRIDLVADCPILKAMDPEEVRRMAALNIAMVRIIKSVELN